MVGFSGGKGLRGPQSAGLLLGKRKYIEAARMHTPPRGETIGRGMKVNKEEVLGMLAALELYLQKAHEKNGCMWFIPKEDDQIRTHHAVVAGGALSCKASIDEAVCIPLQPGDCTFHDGFTLHYSKGNTTAQNRRA